MSPELEKLITGLLSLSFLPLILFLSYFIAIVAFKGGPKWLKFILRVFIITTLTLYGFYLSYTYMGALNSFVLDKKLFSLLLLNFITVFSVIAYLKLYHRNPETYYVVESRRILKKMRSWKCADLEQKIFSELRSINHFLFEEVIISAIKDARGEIPNPCGLSGEFRFNDKTYSVATKQGNNYISDQDLIKHKEYIFAHKYMGLFVHTGKTGSEDRESRGNIQIIGGVYLLDLLLLRRPLNEIIY